MQHGVFVEHYKALIDVVKKGQTITYCDAHFQNGKIDPWAIYNKNGWHYEPDEADDSSCI